MLRLLLGFASCLAGLVSAHQQANYPSQGQIADIFGLLNTNATAFYANHVAPNVNWTLMGTHPLAGRYSNLGIFVTDAVVRLQKTLDPTKPTSFEVTRVIGGGSEWSVQELHGVGTLRTGKIYDNKFAWVTRWNTTGFVIVEVDAYLDSALVQQTITENESGEHTYKDVRRALEPGPAGAGCTNTLVYNATMT